MSQTCSYEEFQDRDAWYGSKINGATTIDECKVHEG